jgi:uncharacterized membrane protein
MNAETRTTAVPGTFSSARERGAPNGQPVNEWQRWGALLGGGALAVYGISRRSSLGVALATAGGAVAYLGAKKATAARANPVARASVVVNSSPEEAYRFWRNFENLPRFMHHLESVRETGPRRTHWVAAGPPGARIEWDAETVIERPNESISWRSVEGSDFEHEGVIEFRLATGNRGTLVDVRMRYAAPAGPLGRGVARMIGKDPSFLMQQDLRRFKALVETGEIPTTEGQPHGPRERMTAAFRMVDPDRPPRRHLGVLEAVRVERRIS